MPFRQEIEAIKSGKPELREFGLTMGNILALIGGWMLYRGRHGGAYFLVVAAAFFVLATLFPVALKPLQKAWMTLAVVLGSVMSLILLAALFYLIVTPTGWLGRVLGKEFINRDFRKSAVGSYWVKRTTKIGRRDCERQF